MNTHIIISRYCTLLQIADVNLGRPPEWLCTAIEQHCSYTHLTALRQNDPSAIDPITGERHYVRAERLLLFRYDTFNRPILTMGYLPWLTQLLNGAGVTFSIMDDTPPRNRPNCYQTEPKNLDGLTFRPRQAECLQTLTNCEGGVINAPTGWGKSFLFGCIGRLYPRARLHVVMKSKDLAIKTYKEMLDFLPSVGLVCSGSKLMERVTVFTADSLHHSDGDADILILEEAHELCATRYATLVMERYICSRNFAFSASPYERFDNAHAQLEMMCGPLIFEMGYEEAVTHGSLVPLAVDWVLADFQNDPSRMARYESEINQFGIWQHEARNNLIAQEVARLVDPNDQTLVMVQTLEHALFLQRSMPEYELCYGGGDKDRIATLQDMGLWTSRHRMLKSRDREQMRLQFKAGVLRKVIATDVWSKGVSFESLQNVVRADGRAGNGVLDTQIPGRTSRIDGDKSYGRVIDIYDRWSPKFDGRSNGRRRNYEEHGWEQRGAVPVPRRESSRSLGSE